MTSIVSPRTGYAFRVPALGESGKGEVSMYGRRSLTT